MKRESVFVKQLEIERNYKGMTEEQMHEALSELCELVKREMIEKVENALYWMNNKKY